MDIELFKHNEEAYKKAKELFEKENKCAIIHPTGTGKSYIALKWLLDNKDKKAIYVTSHLAIKDQLERTIRENNLSLEEDFPNLEIITYSSLLHNNDMKTDLIVLDEFHRAGAPKWGEAVKKFLDNNKESKVLGLTATPVRYLNRNRDMSDEIFGGNVASHITLPKAIAEGILPPPTYINAIYSFKEDIEKIEQKIAKITDNERKKELEKELKLAKRTIENAENIEEIFKKYMTKENGKYLVFCRDINHLEEMKDEANNWFKELNKNVETHYIHSLEDEDYNKYTLDRFHYVKNDNLKLLYSVGMLNEGVHVNDIDGVIMLRPTSSPILYQQQLGRALTTGKNHKPLVFDVVNNIECLKDIELLRDTVIKIMEKTNKPKKEIQRMQETFKIIDDYKNISTLIKELNINATYGWDEKYELLKQYVEEHNGLFPLQIEPIIGSWLSNQRQALKHDRLSKERKEELDALGNWSKSPDEINEEKWEEKYQLLKQYVEEHDGLFPLQIEPIIGTWLNTQRQVLKHGKLNKERREKLDVLGDWSRSRYETNEEQWEEKYRLLKQYIEEHNGKFPIQKEPIIGRWLHKQRQALKERKISEERKQKLDALGDWSINQYEINEEQWEEKYQLLKQYVEEHNGTFPSRREPIIGNWLDKQKTSFKKNKLNEEKKQKLDALGYWSKGQDEIWNENYKLLKQYVEEHNGKIPAASEPIIGAWFFEQKTTLRKNKLSEERKQKLDALGDWSKSRYETNEEQWEEKYQMLKKYIEEHNGKIPTASEPIIGKWLSNQRKNYKKGKLSEEKKQKLDSLVDWSKSQYEINEEQWEEKYKLLKQYINENNGKNPPQKEPIIGKWLNKQRTVYKKGKLSEERKQKLDALGDWTLSSRKKVSNVKNLKEKSNEKKANKTKK